jgi:hypothetical protein
MYVRPAATSVHTPTGKELLVAASLADMQPGNTNRQCVVCTASQWAGMCVCCMQHPTRADASVCVPKPLRSLDFGPASCHK